MDNSWENFLIYCLKRVLELDEKGEKILMSINNEYMDLDAPGKGNRMLSISLGRKEYENKTVTDDVLFERLIKQIS